MAKKGLKNNENSMVDNLVIEILLENHDRICYECKAFPVNLKISARSRK
jgi:hypothetical protein